MTKTILEEYAKAHSEQLMCNSELISQIMQLRKKLEIATKALKETEEKLLHVELSGLDGNNRQKMYDLMFDDGVIDKALKEMEGIK